MTALYINEYGSFAIEDNDNVSFWIEPGDSISSLLEMCRPQNKERSDFSIISELHVSGTCAQKKIV